MIAEMLGKIIGKRYMPAGVCLLVLFGISHAFAAELIADVAVVVHKNNPVSAMSVKEIKNMYNNTVITWADGERVKLFDLRTRDPVRRFFSWHVLGQSSADVAREWSRIKIRNRAKNAPRVVKRARSILARVAVDEHALAYVSIDDVTDQVKVVAVIKP